jgi:two-component system sensor histidine kinase DesK
MTVKAQTGWWTTVMAWTRGRGGVPRAEGSKQRLWTSKILNCLGPMRVIVLIALLSFGAVQEMQQFTRPLSGHWPHLGGGVTSPVLREAAGVAGIVVPSALVAVVILAPAERWRLRCRLVTLAVAGLVTYLPLAVSDRIWGGMAGYFAGSAVTLISGWAAWALFAAAIGSMVLVSVMWQLAVHQTVYLAWSSAILGVTVFGLARVAMTTKSFDARASEIVEFAVINERMRFARDLHDLLGYSLSAIAIKAEFVKRLVSRNPGQAQEELAEVADIARRALEDVRVVANGYRRLSLAKEACSVTSLLGAAGISAQVEITREELDENLDTVLATVLRESVTNLLRHSTARNCTIAAQVAGETLRLLVTNDGVRSGAAPARRGRGLENLAARLAAIGGRLTAEVQDGWFSVLAEVPLAPPSAASHPDTGTAACPRKPT